MASTYFRTNRKNYTMKSITDNCPLCKHEFTYNPTSDSKLQVDLNNTENIYEEFPIQDETWSSRWWNKDRTISTDLSGGHFICQDCYEKRIHATDVNVDGHRICSKRGCPNDAGFSKYCYECYD